MMKCKRVLSAGLAVLVSSISAAAFGDESPEAMAEALIDESESNNKSTFSNYLLGIGTPLTLLLGCAGVARYYFRGEFAFLNGIKKAFVDVQIDFALLKNILKSENDENRKKAILELIKSVLQKDKERIRSFVGSLAKALRSAKLRVVNVGNFGFMATLFENNTERILTLKSSDINDIDLKRSNGNVRNLIDSFNNGFENMPQLPDFIWSII
jgi:hypothetical protein